MGHETRRGGGDKQWGKHSFPPAILAFLQKGGQKIFYFCDFFVEPIFASGMTPKINIFLRFFFFLWTTIPCAGNLIFLQIFRIRSVLRDSFFFCRQPPEGGGGYEMMMQGVETFVSYNGVCYATSKWGIWLRLIDQPHFNAIFNSQH